MWGWIQLPRKKTICKAIYPFIRRFTHSWGDLPIPKAIYNVLLGPYESFTKITWPIRSWCQPPGKNSAAEEKVVEIPLFATGLQMFYTSQVVSRSSSSINRTWCTIHRFETYESLIKSIINFARIRVNKKQTIDTTAPSSLAQKVFQVMSQRKDIYLIRKNRCMVCLPVYHCTPTYHLPQKSTRCTRFSKWPPLYIPGDEPDFRTNNGGNLWEYYARVRQIVFI